MTTTVAGRPALQEIIKQAMEGAAARVDISLESARQIANAGGTPPAVEKTASALPSVRSLPTDLTTKLASALDYVAVQMDPKLAAIDIDAKTTDGVGPGEGPNALDVTHAISSDAPLQPNASGKAIEQPPKNPAQQKDPTRPADPGTGLETNDSTEHREQPIEPIPNQKTTLSNEQAKESSAYANNLLALGLARVEYDTKGQPQIVKAAGIGGAITGALGGGALGAGLGALAGHALGIGAGTGAKWGATLGAAGGALHGSDVLQGVGAPPAAEAQPKVAAEENTLERKGRKGGALAGTIAGSVGGERAGRALAEVLGAGALRSGLARAGGAVLGAGIGHHIGGRLGRAAGGAAEHRLDMIDPKGKKEASAALKNLALRMAKTALDPEMMTPEQIDAAQAYGAARAPQVHGALVGDALGALGGGAAGYHFTPLNFAGKMMGGTLGAIHGGLAGAGIGSAVDAARMTPEQHAQMTLNAEDAAQANKQASVYARNLLALGLKKQAEDAINPAQISAGKIDDIGVNSPDGATPAGVGVPSEPSDVNSQKRLIESNLAAIGYTRREAKSDPKKDLGAVLNEPALSAEHDRTLNEAFDHTEEAGAKIGSAQTLKIAAARAVLNKLAQQQVVGKKTKKSMMGGAGGAPNTPQAASGFTAGAQM